MSSDPKADKARLAAVDAVVEKYKQRKAVLILDLTGFTSASLNFGVVPAMAGVQEVWDRVKPSITPFTPLFIARGGLVLKDEADTFYALLNNAPDALNAALVIQNEVDRLYQEIVGKRGKDKLRFCTSIGIGFGDVYVIGIEDAFGLEVNFAYNAGEVQAKANEILLTKSAMKAVSANLPNSVKKLQEKNFGKYSLWHVVRKTMVGCAPM